MVKQAVVFFFLILLSFSVTRTDIYTHGEVYNLLPMFFKEPVETLVVLFSDFTIMRFTNYEENRIIFSFEEVLNFLKLKNMDVHDIVAMIHNHHIDGFSETDIATIKRLRRTYNYRGKFGVYLPHTDTIYWWDDTLNRPVKQPQIEDKK